MSNPVVLITGALTGTGRATAIAFAKEGAKLVVTGRPTPDQRAMRIKWKEGVQWLTW